MNKKGFELVWNNIVVMILAFFVLLFLILFFSAGSGSFYENIKGYFSYSNVDSIIEGCNILSSSNSEYAFCCEKKVVKYYMNGEESKGEFSCKELTEKAFINGRINNMMCGENICG